MLQNWKDAISCWSHLKAPHSEYDSRYDSRSPYTALPKWLRDSCSYTEMSSYERHGMTVIFTKNLCTSLGGSGTHLITTTVKLWIDEASYLFHSMTVDYGSLSIKQHPCVSRCLCKLTIGIDQNKHANSRILKAVKLKVHMKFPSKHYRHFLQIKQKKKKKIKITFLFSLPLLLTKHCGDHIFVSFPFIGIPCWHFFGSFYDYAS